MAITIIMQFVGSARLASEPSWRPLVVPAPNRGNIVPNDDPIFRRSDRVAYARKWEQLLLSNGHSTDVHAIEDGDENFGQTPVLMFFGHFSKALVYQLVSAGGILQAAKKLDFKTVTFFDKGPDGLYTFDIRGSQLPRCSQHNRVCI